MKLAPLIIATAFADKKSAAFERIAKAEEHDYDAANWLDAEFGTTDDGRVESAVEYDEADYIDETDKNALDSDNWLDVSWPEAGY